MRILEEFRGHILTALPVSFNDEYNNHSYFRKKNSLTAQAVNSKTLCQVFIMGEWFYKITHNTRKKQNQRNEIS